MRHLWAIIAGAAALGLGYAGNRLIWRLCRGRGTAWLVPLCEEIVKTGIGLWAGPVLLVHILFGCGEAALEIWQRHPVAGALAAVSHTCFGLLTVAGWPGVASGLPLRGWLWAILAHLAWNQAVLRLALPRRP